VPEIPQPTDPSEEPRPGGTPAADGGTPASDEAAGADAEAGPEQGHDREPAAGRDGLSHTGPCADRDPEGAAGRDGLDTPGPDGLAAPAPDGPPADGGPRGLVPDSVRQVAARATLPFQAARADRSFATAFWFNDLVEVAGDHEVIRQYLVTAARRTRFEVGQLTLREEVVDDAERAVDILAMGGFAKRWTPLEGLGVAVMPTVDMHLHAERKGWAWESQEITDGLAAREEDIASIGAEPLAAYVLGHAVDETAERDPDRPQRMLAGHVSRPTPDATLTWSGPALPDGFDGAPVFAGLALPDDQVKLLCLGAALTGAQPGDPVVVTPFDRMRPAVRALAPRRKRRWWQRG
jgi:hypothetical protein